MTLIKSISGIRGTIGGKAGDGFSPLDILKFTAAFGTWLKKRSGKEKITMIVGRDARISGSMVNAIVSGTLTGLGIDVMNLGLATTPTVEIAVTNEKADGGIIITASHNPKQWNALKLLNELGEFISATEGEEVLAIAEFESFDFAEVDHLGKVTENFFYDEKHIRKILDLPLVDVKAIQAAGFRVAIDCVNSVGGIVLPKLLDALGVKETIKLFCIPDGIFPHNPEPLPENLTEISNVVRAVKADLGFVVDPDVDRLAIVNEDGTMFGEEYTLVAVADYILKNKPGNTVSNLSSTMALRDVTNMHGGIYFASAVGEVNVVHTMKAQKAVIGGEGNGGIIYPDLHFGRDALVGIALFLTHLAKSKLKCSQLRDSYPNYFMSKNKITLSPDINVDQVLEKVQETYSNFNINTIDGVKVDFGDEWVHLRKSNTEPIIRIYSESNHPDKANHLAENVMVVIRSLM